ncbi:MAG: hypothetical protein Q4G52_03080 [Clostridia bacterium]|nr:hypothetical protein [Clostridia bacterium]
MRYGQKKVGLACMALLLTLALLPIPALAAHSEDAGLLRYTKTGKIYAKLSISGGVATCDGYVQPSGEQDCSVTVTLYKQNGSNWTKVKSWSASATGGQKASVIETKTVGRGTYKVVAKGNVDGETSSAESAAKTY